MGRFDASGNLTKSSPTKTARISDGHNIIFDSPWDITFEQFFDRPDNDFPSVINRLGALVAIHKENESKHCPHDCKEGDLVQLCNCLLSLVVRSPKFRNDIITFVRNVRETVAKEEHKNLIAANIQRAYRALSKGCSGRGKYMVIFSRDREFIFGDGFYTNINLHRRRWFGVRILTPLTPHIAVLYVQPNRYRAEPRLVTIEAEDEMIATINQTIQVYSRDYLFFRSEIPLLTDHFLQRKHFIYAADDPVLCLIEEMLGIGSS